jgi:phi LC3 family holin
MQINWKVRIRNKVFWTSLISALALLGQAIAGLLGYTIDFSTLAGKLVVVVDAVFAVLVVLGINVDPTTEGYGDSDRAMTYVKPWVDEPDDE